MAIKIGKILGTLADVLPLGAVAKSIVKGAGSLLLKKAAKVVGIKEEKVDELFVEASKIAEYDHEIKKALLDEEKQKRAHELAVFGRFAELDEGSQKWVARIRPMLSFGLVGTYIAYCWAYLIAQLFPYWFGFEIPPVIPPSLIKVTIAVCFFWFAGRSWEKVEKIKNNGDKLNLKNLLFKG